VRRLSTIEEKRLGILTSYSVPITLIEPTETGLKKSILDATGPVRRFLKESKIHDYYNPPQGPDYKETFSSFLVGTKIIIPSKVSLYRPKTKKGDPRIWFKGLPNYSKPNDIIAITYNNNTLYCINLTTIAIEYILENSLPSPLLDLVQEINSLASDVSNELLYKIRTIANNGPIPSTIIGDTAIGRALEPALGIEINSRKEPDYKGIELKSFRSKKNGGRENRKNLFAQVPDWSLSKFKSSAEILNNFGYEREEDFKLYCTVSAITRNSQGLNLKIDNDIKQLIENSDKPEIGDFVVWTLDKLHNRLREKHKETFWVEAESTRINDREHFQYKLVEHTKKPITSQFDLLIDQGIITLDHLIKRNSKGKVVEKGPLFKIKPKGIELLFPPSERYSLI